MRAQDREYLHAHLNAYMMLSEIIASQMVSFTGGCSLFGVCRNDGPGDTSGRVFDNPADSGISRNVRSNRRCLMLPRLAAANSEGMKRDKDICR